MSLLSKQNRKLVIFIGLGTALLIALFLSPFASQNPDGLDRVAQDLKFEEKAEEKPPAHHLPSYQVFDEYAMRGLPGPIATPIAGLVGTLAAFGLAWSIGKAVSRKPGSSNQDRSL